MVLGENYSYLALPPPKLSLGAWAGEGLSGGRKAGVTLKRRCLPAVYPTQPTGCVAVEVGMGHHHGVRQVHQPHRKPNFKFGISRGLTYAEAGERCGRKPDGVS